MMKLVAVVRRRPEVPAEEFYRIWREDLPPLVSRLPGLRGYQQNHAVPRERGWPWDGAAELWFDDRRAIQTAMSSPEAIALAAFEQTFIGTVEKFVAEEHTIIPPGRTDR
ncbi:EthD family reductase [Nocardia huaxiensis]|uniref:EthD family reductase n=1 Tax=Nocardia huaxiensis TaxID=2755382 RepID=UPI001E2B89C4|nr:EthD family reductase [Nocardia huaxiensis]UFS98525.1 EthD family reductase [Nocardia huaxiensis]